MDGIRLMKPLLKSHAEDECDRWTLLPPGENTTVKLGSMVSHQASPMVIGICV